MSPSAKNTLVGVVVLIGLVLLSWMILTFGDAPIKFFAEPELEVTFVADRADGISEGSPVLYRGVSVGQVDVIERVVDGVRMTAKIEDDPPIPANVVGEIKVQQLIGGGAALFIVDKPRDSGGEPDGSEKAPVGNLKIGDEIETTYVGLAVLPKEITQLSAELTLLAKDVRKADIAGEFAELAEDIRKTSASIRESQVVEEFAATAKGLRDQLNRAGVLIDSVQQLVGDEQVQADVKAMVASLREGSDKLNKLLDQARGSVTAVETNIADLSKQTSARLDEVATLMRDLQSVTQKIDKGEGTAGKLINDPRLYKSLVETAQQLNMTVKDLQRLIQQWEQEGVRLKLD